MKNLIKLTPAFKDYIWGGTRLRDDYGKECDYDRIAESWELSANKDGQCTICEGPDSGMPFGEYINKIGKENLGTKCANLDFFPLMIKLIDAQDNLSIQVHPDNEYALAHENSFGKNEMWYILDCEPGAFLYAGFKEKVTPEEVEKRIKNNTLLEILNKVYVKPGQSVFINSGTVHAIGAGILVCEIQQNSNVTYRIYDYGRVGADGKQRQLHLEQALKVLNYDTLETPVGERTEEECACVTNSQYFSVYSHKISGEVKIEVDDTSFVSLIFLEGEGEVSIDQDTYQFKKGDTFFAQAGKHTISINGTGVCLSTTM